MCKYYNLKMPKVSRDTHFLMILYPWLFMMSKRADVINVVISGAQL